jgi:hypothetical protein
MLPNIRPITTTRHKAVNIAKMSIYIRGKNGFFGWQLQVAVDGHDFWETETYMHKPLTMHMSTKSLNSRENIARK